MDGDILSKIPPTSSLFPLQVMALTALLDVIVVLVVVTGALLLLLEEVNVSVLMVWPSL